MNESYRYLCLTFALLALLASCTVTTINAPGQMTWSREDLQQIVDDWRIQSGAPGVVVGLSLADQTELFLTSGESDIKNHVPMKAENQFQIASITKTFIAAEILLLAAQDELHLEDTLDTYLDKIPYGDVVTIRHLLSHRSGYFDPIHDDPGFIPALARDLTREWTWEEMLSITFQQDLFFPPGSDYKYSNTNYLLLALVIEEITQKPLGQVLTSTLITPLQLQHTAYRTVATDIRQPDLVHGYATHPATGESIDILSVPNTAILSVSTDTMISNAADLLKWLDALYGNGTAILKPAFQKQMLTFDDTSPYGLGVFKFDTSIGISFGHGGDTAGYLSLMEYYPNQDLSMVILVNADSSTIRLMELRNLLLAALFPVDQTADVKDLVTALESPSGSVRKDAILALGHLRSTSDEVVRALIRVLKNDSIPENRKEAALVLGLVGRNSDEARSALNDALLQDEDDSVRGAAAVSLSMIE